jgi:hypothetical protein
MYAPFREAPQQKYKMIASSNPLVYFRPVVALNFNITHLRPNGGSVIVRS